MDQGETEPAGLRNDGTGSSMRDRPDRQKIETGRATDVRVPQSVAQPADGSAHEVLVVESEPGVERRER